MKPATLLMVFMCLAGLPLAPARADSAQPLATIVNDRNADVHTLRLDMTDAKRVKGISVLTRRGHAAPPTTRRFSVEAIASPTGAVLDGDERHKAIILQGHIDGAGGHGVLVVRYIRNGLFGGYGECRVRLVRDGGRWHLLNAYTQRVVTALTIRTWSLGIRTIDGICPAGS